MRILILVIALMLSLTGLSAQKSVKKLIDKIKKHPQSVTMTLPGWLISKAVNAASSTTDIKKDEDVWLQMAKDIKKIRFSVVDDSNNLFQVQELDEYIQKAKDKDGFEVYAKVKNDGNRVKILLKTKEEVIKNILIYAFSSDNVAAIHLKTDIALDDFRNAKFSFNKQKGLEVEESIENE